MNIISGRFPTVPEYYMEHIDSDVDLTDNPKQCCPFHKEETPSFSYNPATGRWSCFGSCHAHGDVIEMHKRWFHLETREEAERDLRVRYNLPKESYYDRLLKATAIPMVSDENVENNVSYVEALLLANTPERWIELDYLMSKYPFDKVELDILINKWKGVKSILEAD